MVAGQYNFYLQKTKDIFMLNFTKSTQLLHVLP